MRPPAEAGEVALRPMTFDDLPDVLRIETLSFTFPWNEEFFCGELVREVTRSLVAVRGEAARGRVCGYIMAWLIEDELHINNLAVDPSCRGRHLAARLLSRLLAEAIAEGVRTATLEVRQGNQVALALYRRFGFREEGRRRGYYRDGEDAIILTRELDGKAVFPHP